MLAQLSDQDLVFKLKEKVQEERAALVELLLHLAEVERRQLFLARGYSSLFAFCVGELKYSDHEAHVRIQAMRLQRSVPQVANQLSSGELSLTVAAKAQGCFHRAAKIKRSVSQEKKLKILKAVANKSCRAAESVLLGHFPLDTIPAQKIKSVSEELTRIEFNLTQAQLEKLERLKGLLAHKNYDGRLDKLFELMADIALAKFARDGRVIADAPLLGAPQVKPRQVKPLQTVVKIARSSSVKSSRSIAKSVQRQVWARDRGECQYQDLATGRRCNSRFALELDHIRPYAHGGEHSEANLRLLCAAHNKWRAGK